MNLEQQTVALRNRLLQEKLRIDQQFQEAFQQSPWVARWYGRAADKLEAAIEELDRGIRWLAQEAENAELERTSP